jgi:NhaP-type Na+/H+ or K+/H+ antiporter
MHDEFVTGLVAVAVLGGVAQWLGWRLRLPAILLLILFGLAAGPEGLGLVPTDAMFGDLLVPFVSVAVAILLFEGALTLHLPELGASAGIVVKLVTLGAATTWALAALGAHVILELPWPLAILVGAILTVTGPTVVIPLLRQIRPTGPGGVVLKWEGILIDPLGAVLAVLVFEALVGGGSSSGALMGVGRTLASGVVFGVLPGWLLTVCLERYWIPDHLHSAAALALALLGYALANVFQQEAGLLAVTVMGVFLANQHRVDISHITEFKENLQILLISALFILLAARVQWSDVREIAAPEFVFLALLVLVVRPVSVALCTVGSSLSLRDRVLLASMAPRGVVAAAVTAVFALRLEQESFAGAERLVPIVFLVIAGSVAIYGLVGRPLAIRLGLAQRNPSGVVIVGAHAVGRSLAQSLSALGLPALLVDTNLRRIRAARMDGLRAYHGSVLSDEADVALELPGIGKLFAMTSNDDVNAFSARHFVHLFGRQNLFQVAPSRRPTEGASELGSELRARVLFEEGLTLEELHRRVASGQDFKATPLTDRFGLDEWRAQYGEAATPLLTVDDDGTLTVGTADSPLDPEPGDTLLGLVDVADPTIELTQPVRISE